jgi:KDO2-lipid IV(A) lauroyltransferase
MLYLGSDICCFLLYHVVRYRRKVVRDNLVKSFPEKSAQEIKLIEKRFYHNFCDLIAETLKLRRWKPDKVLEQVTVTNPELIQKLYANGKSVLIAMHHSSNWEWLWKILYTTSQHDHYAVYKKLENHYFDQVVYKIRTSHITDRESMIEDRKMKQAMDNMKDSLNAVFVLGDQSPKGADTDYWTDFLHRDTCWYTGLEILAKRYDYAVVYAEMIRPARGKYTVTFKLITDHPQATGEGTILEQYVRQVERFIQNNPDNWLWSHRRWKHTRQNKAS